MTTCEQHQDNLIDYHYQTLSSDSARDLAAHLVECGECARAYCHLHATLRGVRDHLEARPSAEVSAKLREAVEARFTPWWRRLWRALVVPVPVYQVALLLLFLAGSWWLWPSTSPSSTGARDAARPSLETPPGSPEDEAPSAPRTIFEGYGPPRVLILSPNAT